MLFGGNPQEVGKLRAGGKFRVSLVSADLLNGDENSLGRFRILPSSKNLFQTNITRLPEVIDMYAKM